MYRKRWDSEDSSESLNLNSRCRRHQDFVLSNVVKKLGIEGHESLLVGRQGYGLPQINPDNIPSDAEIEVVLDRILAPHRMWANGILAAYKLWSHEPAEVELKQELNAVIDDAN